MDDYFNWHTWPALGAKRGQCLAVAFEQVGLMRVSDAPPLVVEALLGTFMESLAQPFRPPGHGGAESQPYFGQHAKLARQQLTSPALATQLRLPRLSAALATTGVTVDDNILPISGVEGGSSLAVDHTRLQQAGLAGPAGPVNLTGAPPVEARRSPPSALATAAHPLSLLLPGSPSATHLAPTLPTQLAYPLLSIELDSSSTSGLIPRAGRAARAGPGRAEIESSSTGDGDPVELDSRRRRSGERLARLNSDGFWLSDGTGLDAAGREKLLRSPQWGRSSGIPGTLVRSRLGMMQTYAWASLS